MTKKVVILVYGMMSVLDALGVDKRLRHHSGIYRVETNFLNSTATVEYDENQVTLAEIKQLISKCGYECLGECLPQHMCKMEDP